MQVTVLFFHPYPERSIVNRALAHETRNVPGIQFRDMYSIYPEFSIDVDREQEIVAAADVLVFQHPLYWYSCPSLMKEWIDAVLERGWAYGPGGDRLQGKYWMQAISTGGSSFVYESINDGRLRIHGLLRPFEQTAVICGMKPLQPFLTHNARSIEHDLLKKRAIEYRHLLEAIQRGELPPVYSTDPNRETQT